MTTNIKSLGRLKIQVSWSRNEPWHYFNRKNEKVNLHFFMGTVEVPEGDVKLYQFVVWRLMISWGWTN
jgi:hypothetical protein